MRIAGQFVEFRFARNQAGHPVVIIQHRLKKDAVHLAGHQHGALPLGIRVFQERNQAVSVEPLGRLRQAEQLDQRRIDIEQGNRLVAHNALRKAGAGDNQVAVRRVVPRLNFGPRILFAEHIAVVAPEHHIARFSIGTGIPRFQHAPDLFVGKSHARQIGAHKLFVVAFFDQHLVIALAELRLKAGDQLEAFRQIVQIVDTSFGELQRFGGIFVKILLGHNPRHVRTVNTQRKEKRIATRPDGFDGLARRFIVAHFRGGYIGDIPDSGGV